MSAGLGDRFWRCWRVRLARASQIRQHVRAGGEDGGGGSGSGSSSSTTVSSSSSSGLFIGYLRTRFKDRGAPARRPGHGCAEPESIRRSVETDGGRAVHALTSQAPQLR